MPSTVAMPWELFLSTPSARRATHAGVLRVLLQQISIHALREEGDGVLVDVLVHRLVFLSTPSARRATGVSVGYRIDTIISIHALREEGDTRA